MNQMSVSSISVPECKPSIEGEDISRLDFDAWQDLLNNSLALAGIIDEATQFTVFKVKAGQKLLEVFRATESSSEAPDLEMRPFSNAMFRLKTYFASTSDVMLQRRKLALMTQQSNESDLAFIRRVGIAARQCEYPEGKQFEEVLSTVAEQAKHKEVRIAALRMMNRKAAMADLVDKVREIETIRLNEEYVAKKQAVAEPSTISVNAVRATGGPSRYVASYTTPAYGRTPYQRSNLRGSRGQRASRGGSTWRGSSSPVPERCTRCNSIYHSAERCFAVKMTCHNCGGVGHLLRACTLPVAPRNRQLLGERKFEEQALAVDVVGTKPEGKLDDENAEKSDSERDVSTVATTLAEVHEQTDSGIVNAMVAGMPCEFLIDSGAQVNTVTQQMFEKLIANEEYCKGLHNIQPGSDRPLKAYATSDGIQVLCTL
nr:uncharacterized protein LOC115259696 [Aedes albopictus]